MGSKWHAVPLPELDGYEKKFRALHKDWHYFHKLMEAYGKSSADSERLLALEMAFLELKGRVSCDYTVLAVWRSGAFGVPAGIGDLFADGSTLKTLSEDVVEGTGRTEEEWRLVDDALGYLRQILVECQNKTKPGKAAKLPAEFFSQGTTSQAIEKYCALCRALQADWRRIHKLLQAFLDPGADRRKLEAELLRLKSKIATEYPTLPSWFGGTDGASNGLGRILDSSSSLASLSGGGRTQGDWKSVDDSIGRIRNKLVSARADAGRGKDVKLPHGFIIQRVRKPFPIKKVLQRLSIVAAVCLVFGGAYFLRYFVGVGAPPPGAGLEIPASLADEEQAEAILMVMNEAFVQGSVDTFMTTIARDFTDDEGNGRRALRIVLQAFHTRGEFVLARVIWGRATYTRSGDWIYANPVIIRANVEGEEDLYLKMGFKQKGGKWLISSAEGYS
jgi:hypothetical protein